MLQATLFTKKADGVSSLGLGLALLALLSLPLAANAQRDSDPNIGHFYMARQQISITDDSPVINNRQGGGAAPGAQQGAGGMPAGPMPLAPARWQSFAPPPTAPSLSTSLPQVNHGLPTRGPMPGTGNRGNTGRLPARGPGAAVGGGGRPAVVSKPGGPSAAGYTPYKKFAVEAPAAASMGNGANGKVYGDVLHWARQHH